MEAVREKSLCRIGIWGQYGDGGVVADGQAVKTIIISQEIEHRYGADAVIRVNTNQWKRTPIRFLCQSIGLVAQSNKIVILPADNGFKVFVPLLSIVNLFYQRELLYVVIGGFLPKLLQKNTLYIQFLKRLKAIFAETPNMKSDLEEFNLKNVHYLANLKRLQPVLESEVTENNEQCIKLCLFSRITKDKGVIDAVKAVKMANDRLSASRIKLDIYGIVAESFRPEFDELMSSNASFVEYKGVADYDKTVDVLKNYFALMFPTYFNGEGFPGCLIDAFNSALPVIATDWLYNKDIIRPEINGLLVPVKDPESLCDAILKLYFDRNLARNIALNNLKEANKYSPENVLRGFFSYLD